MCRQQRAPEAERQIGYDHIGGDVPGFAVMTLSRNGILNFGDILATENPPSGRQRMPIRTYTLL